MRARYAWFDGRAHVGDTVRYDDALGEVLVAHHDDTVTVAFGTQVVRVDARQLRYDGPVWVKDAPYRTTPAEDVAWLAGEVRGWRGWSALFQRVRLLRLKAVVWAGRRWYVRQREGRCTPKKVCLPK